MMAMTTSNSTSVNAVGVMTFHDFFIGAGLGISTDLVICARSEDADRKFRGCLIPDAAARPEVGATRIRTCAACVLSNSAAGTDQTSSAYFASLARRRDRTLQSGFRQLCGLEPELLSRQAAMLADHRSRPQAEERQADR